MPSRPNDFPKSVRDDLAKRVAYHCSTCGASTVGAKAGRNGAASIGVAAHICAASPGGPRYDPTMSDAGRREIANGIWLCQNCGTKVDTDWEAYPKETLEGWRTAAEIAANANLGVAPTSEPKRDADRHALIQRLGQFLAHYIQLESRCIRERGSDEVELSAIRADDTVATYLEREFDQALAFQFKAAVGSGAQIGYPFAQTSRLARIRGRRAFLGTLIDRVRG